MNTSQRAVVFALGLAVVAPLSTAVAQVKEPDADALIMRGLDLRRAGQSEEALILFRRAFQTAPSPRTLGQMGLVESSLQLWIDADAHLGAALTTPGDTWVHRNRRFLDQAMDHAREHVGELAITGPPGARISVAGKRAGALPLTPLRLAEGEVDISASADGRKPYSVQVSIKGGARVAISIALEPLELARRPRLSRSSRPRSLRPERGCGGRALAAAGTVVLAWGITWIALDGRPTCGHCTSSYDTKTPGIPPPRRWERAGAGRRRAALLDAPFRRSRIRRSACRRVRFVSKPTSEAARRARGARRKLSVGGSEGNNGIFAFGSMGPSETDSLRRRRIDRYELHELIGEGGMGAVYRAIDSRLGRTVALKTVVSHRAAAGLTNELRQRFMREALAASKVDHRNVVQVIDFGVAEDGTPYLVMEYLRGRDLGEVLRQAKEQIGTRLRGRRDVVRLRSAPRLPPARGRSPRSQTEQHLPGRHRHGARDQGARFRRLEDAHRRRPHAGRADPRDAAVPVARAGQRQGGTRERSVRARRVALRLSHEETSLRGAPEPEPLARHRGRALPRSARTSAGNSRRAGSGHPARHARQSRRALPFGARARPGALELRQLARPGGVEELLPPDTAGRSVGRREPPRRSSARIWRCGTWANSVPTALSGAHGHLAAVRERRAGSPYCGEPAAFHFDEAGERHATQPGDAGTRRTRQVAPVGHRRRSRWAGSRHTQSRPPTP